MDFLDQTEKAREEKDFISRLMGVGSLSSAMSDNIRGININLNGTPAPKNQDHYGITFFTRPDLNLTSDNISTTRILTPLLNTDTTSMARVLRVILDPRSEQAGLRSDIFDTRQAFIPILTNNLLSVSGWPDIVADTYTSKEGMYKESWSMVDGTTHLFGTYDITANFKNIQGDPITLLFTIWTHYASMVYDGTMVPYPDNVLENRKDYETRIYRLVLDSDFRYVQKIGACGAGFPMASPLGASFNYSNDTEYMSENDQISIPFRCQGAMYLDPILISEFNETVYSFNDDMRNGNRGQLMVKISAAINYGKGLGKIGSSLANLLSHKMYPWINEDTYELEWWASQNDYLIVVNQLKNKGLISDE